jgi:TRAP-type mannitol/chloroaromatic compound transport system substrate-binding protein
MISQIVEIIGKLIDVIDQFEQSESDKANLIEVYLRKIEQCLSESVSELENSRTPTEQWNQLRIHAKDLSTNIGDVIGKREADDLSNQLVSVLEGSPEVDVDLKPLKELIGSIKAHADKISLPKSPKSSISRRTIIYSTLGTSAAFATGWFGRQHAPSTSSIKWTMASIFGKSTNKLILSEVPQIISERINTMTGGKFIIEIIENDENAKITTDRITTDRILDYVSEGKIQCGYSGIFYAASRYKPLFFGCAVPFGLSPQEQTAWLLYRKDTNSELTFMQHVYKDLLNLNIIPFPVGGTGHQMGGWFKKEVKSADDFKGLKMRVPGLGADVLEDFFYVKTDFSGGPIPINKIKEALKSGKLDAAEWNGPYDDIELGLNQEAKYYYHPGWWEPSTTLDIQVNSKAWEDLSDQYKVIFRAVCQETYAKTIAKYDQENSKALQTLRDLEKEGEIEVRRFSKEILDKAREGTEKMLEEHSKDENFREVYTEWKKFKARIRSWSELSNLDSI